MTYLKIVLTVIAALLAIGITSRCFISPAIGQTGERINVNIEAVNGYGVAGGIPVTIK